MKNEKNLISLAERTTDEQRKIAQSGGIESGKARRRKRTMKEAAQLILNLPVNAEQKEILINNGIDEKDCTYLTLIMAKTVQMASNGDLKATEFISETLGESPKYKLYEKKLKILAAENNITGSLSDAIIKAYKQRTAK